MKDFFKLKIADLLKANKEIVVTPVTYRGQGFRKIGVGCDIKGKGYFLTIEPIQRRDHWEWLVANHTKDFWVDHFNTTELKHYLKLNLL